MKTVPAAERGVVCRNLVKDYGSDDSRVRALRGVDLDIRARRADTAGRSERLRQDHLDFDLGRYSRRDGRRRVGAGRGPEAAVEARKGGIPGEECRLRVSAVQPASRLDGRRERGGAVGHQRRFPAAAVAQAREVLRSVGLGDRTESLPSQLSGGQQQRVAIARALVHKPRLLVADEPTSAVDARTGQAIMELIRQVALQPDRVAVVVTHDARVFSFGDRIITLEDGRVAATNGVSHQPEAQRRRTSPSLRVGLVGRRIEP